jgi:hypothetical protein
MNGPVGLQIRTERLVVALDVNRSIQNESVSDAGDERGRWRNDGGGRRVAH